MVHYKKPTLLRHGEVWVFHLPSQRQVHIRCPRNNEWVTRNQILSGAGLVQNATRCTITTGEIRTLPELHGGARANLVAPSVYVPDHPPILAKHELPRVEEALVSGVNDLDQLKDRLETQQKWLDVDTLVHVQKSAPRHETSPNLAVVVSAASGALAVLLAFGMFLHAKLQHVVLCCQRTRETTEDDTPRFPTHLVPDPVIPTVNAYVEPRDDSVTFAAYALPCKN
jgi:hypothetical protein